MPDVRFPLGVAIGYGEEGAARWAQTSTPSVRARKGDKVWFRIKNNNAHKVRCYVSFFGSATYEPH